MKLVTTLITSFTFALLSFTAHANQLSAGYELESQWIQALQESDTDKRVAELERVLEEATQALIATPDDVELLIVKANSNLEIANALNSVKSLGYLKEGKRDLEKAIELSPMALDGMAEASLASALYWAPGWPLSYGDKKEAIELFDEALTRNPDSLELLTQYGYVMSLNGEGDLGKARSLFESALQQIEATEQQGRAVFAQIRKKDILSALESIENQ
ncbi:hypothetical protein [Endozoicomonas atrinae]|uniref:hypothetical protein n=1 Tax=Endozoicomonas atrinae TaxID=1333660 RepID=UPI000824C281|nr:hypothetical protein [Endozoicomonas atrinae]